ncbi:MAG: nitroreductase family protein [Vicingus serpentipes]|nr:nitroreductase family protein [Vicingus serpentipes]
MEINKLISERYSPRAFSDQPITEDQIKLILKAASLAASSYNEQPWRFVYALKENQEAFSRVFSCIMDFNHDWAKHAPALIVCVVKDNLSLNDKPNIHAWHDMGLAVGNLSLQALSMGIYVRQMGGFDSEIARTQLSIPKGYTPISVIALGYIGDINNLPVYLQERENSPKQVKPLEEVIFEGTWK